MPRRLPTLSLSLFNHHTDGHYQALVRDRVLDRARRLARVCRDQGLQVLKPSLDPLIQIGMEVSPEGKVTKNSLGVLDLSWQVPDHPEWPAMVRREAEEIRAGIREAHGVELRQVIWAGMGGSAEDKAMYQALGLLRSVPVYLLDSTDPSKLEAILRLIARRSPLRQALRQTLVVGMAMGMTSYEPVLNLEKLHLLYRKHGIPSTANFLYMTLPLSLLDRFAGPRGYRRVELQLDNQNSTAGRHSGPLTRGSLYPLALNDTDLDAWMTAVVLSEEEIQDAFRLAGFLHGNGLDSRDKVTLLLPREWAGAGIWIKQDFEESLGKSQDLGIKILPTVALRAGGRKPVRDARQDQVFWAIRVAGCEMGSAATVRGLRQQGYPLAVLELGGETPLPRFMQWVHYVVFGLGCLREMNFVTQPSVELYKEIANRLYSQARKTGGMERTPEWRLLRRTPYRASAAGEITIYYDSLIEAGLLPPGDLPPRSAGAAEIFAALLARLHRAQMIEYTELTFYGDLRYRPEGRRLRRLLEAAAESTFEEVLGLPADVYEGPAMNHSYHEMIIGHGRCFSTVILTRQQSSLGSIGYRADYHRAQWLATKLALQRRGRAVVALLLPDLSTGSRRALKTFFQQVARALARRHAEAASV
jgi:glucose-6-phosphate isomerase